MNKAVRIVAKGRVQGVSFRYWTQQEAERRQLAGFVRNLSDGAVEAEFFGLESSVDDMVLACRGGPMLARVSDLEVQTIDYRAEAGFQILPTT